MVSKIFIRYSIWNHPWETEEGSSSELLLTPTQQTLLDVHCSLETQMDLVKSEERKESWVDHLELFTPPPPNMSPYVSFPRKYLGRSLKPKLRSHPAKQHALSRTQTRTVSKQREYAIEFS